MAISALGQATVPLDFSENFVEMSAEGCYPAEGWITYGINATPSEQMTRLFDPSKSAYMLFRYGDSAAAISCTNWDPSAQSDEWLITPAFTVGEDEAVLHYTTFSYTNYGTWGLGKAPYQVLVSEGGTAKEDFTMLFEGNVTAQGTRKYSTREYYQTLSGYKGKTIRLAFRQTGQDMGPVGFTDITVGAYYCRIDNLTPAVAEKGDPIGIDLNVYIKTAGECEGFNVTPVIDGETKGTVNFSKKLGGNTPQPQRVTLGDLGTLSDKPVNYTVLVTPAYAGAPSAEVTGVIGIPVTSYPNNIVMEEITATGCVYCPIGIASMEYYKDTYPGTGTTGKFIGVAVHGYVNRTDPMSTGVSGYLSDLMSAGGIASYPSAAFNRATTGAVPYTKVYAENEAELRSNNKLEITAVEYPELKNADDIYGTTVSVSYKGWNSYDAASLTRRAAVILIENNVRGHSDSYDQANAFSTRDENFVANYGTHLVPYMKKFLSGGSHGKGTIPYENMVYNEVARGIWPDFYGSAIAGEWTADSPRELKIEFTVPDTVMEWSNTEVIVIMTDETGRVVASDIFPYSRYTSEGDSGTEITVTDAEGEAVYYNLQGVRVANPGKGIYVRVQGEKASKVVL